MVLFANLKDKTTNSSLALPAALQLYENKPLLFPGTSNIPSYAYMAFQSVSLTATDAPEPLTPSLRNKVAATVEPPPDLGVWTCRVVPSNSTLLQSLVKLSQGSSAKLPPVVVTVDISNPATVEPTLTRLQRTLVRYLISQQDSSTPSETNSSVATTSLAQLQTVQFGLAPEDKNKEKADVTTDEAHTRTKITLVIAVTEDTSTKVTESAEDYTQKQTRALLMYHLRRYAHLLDATLCFVGPETQTEDFDIDSQQQQPTNDNNASASSFQPIMSLMQLGVLLKELALGKIPTLDNLRDDLQLPQWPADSPTQWWYGPTISGDDESESNDTYKELEPILLRYAQFPGTWDAAKDSLWKIFPAPSEPADTTNTPLANAENIDTTAPRDQDWLSELRDSQAYENVSTPMKTSKEATSAKKTPKDADVSNFFESLLKKN